MPIVRLADVLPHVNDILQVHGGSFVIDVPPQKLRMVFEEVHGLHGYRHAVRHAIPVRDDLMVARMGQLPLQIEDDLQVVFARLFHKELEFISEIGELLLVKQEGMGSHGSVGHNGIEASTFNVCKRILVRMVHKKRIQEKRLAIDQKISVFVDQSGVGWGLAALQSIKVVGVLADDELFARVRHAKSKLNRALHDAIEIHFRPHVGIRHRNLLLRFAAIAQGNQPDCAFGCADVKLEHKSLPPDARSQILRIGKHGGIVFAVFVERNVIVGHLSRHAFLEIEGNLGSFEIGIRAKRHLILLPFIRRVAEDGVFSIDESAFFIGELPAEQTILLDTSRMNQSLGLDMHFEDIVEVAVQRRQENTADDILLRIRGIELHGGCPVPPCPRN